MCGHRLSNEASKWTLLMVHSWQMLCGGQTSCGAIPRICACALTDTMTVKDFFLVESQHGTERRPSSSAQWQTETKSNGSSSDHFVDSNRPPECTDNFAGYQCISTNVVAAGVSVQACKYSVFIASRENVATEKCDTNRKRTDHMQRLR